VPNGLANQRESRRPRIYGVERPRQLRDDFCIGLVFGNDANARRHELPARIQCIPGVVAAATIDAAGIEESFSDGKVAHDQPASVRVRR